MRKFTCNKADDGFYHWYWNGNDITGLWMDFFSGLSMKEEKHADWIFAKRFTKMLDEEYPAKQTKD